MRYVLYFYLLSMLFSLNTLAADLIPGLCDLMNGVKILNVQLEKSHEFQIYQIYHIYEQRIDKYIENESNLKLQSSQLEYTEKKLDSTAYTDPKDGKIFIPKKYQGKLALPFIHLHELQHSVDILAENFGLVDENTSSRAIQKILNIRQRIELLTMEGRAYLAMRRMILDLYNNSMLKRLEVELKDDPYLSGVLKIILENRDNDRRFLSKILNYHTSHQLPPEQIEEALRRLGRG